MCSRRQSNRTRRHIRHFKHKKIDYAKYIDDFYLDGELAYISCNVKGKEDIIHGFSVKGYEILNPVFVDFIEENSRYIPLEYPIMLEICGCKFSLEQRKVITETIEDHFALRLGDAQLELDKNRDKSLRLLSMGILTLAVMFVLSLIHLSSEMFNIAVELLVWFFLWEFGDVAWLDRRDLSAEKAAAARLASIKVVYKDVFKDDHDAEAVTNEVIAEVFDES